MHRPSLLLLFLLLPALEVLSQDRALPEPPVRYDEDLLSSDFHRDRRAVVLQALPRDGVAIFFSAPERNREHDVDFEYRQSSDLYYLTGAHEPETVLLLAPAGIDVDGERVTELLMVPPRTEFSDVWLGRRFGAERARAELGLEKAVSNERFEEILTPLLADKTRRFYHLPLPSGVDERAGLARQLAFFTEQAPPLKVEGNYMVQAATNSMLAADSEATFARIKPIVRGRVQAEDFSDPTLQTIYSRFTDADSFEEWQAWRREHVDTRFPDGTTLRSTLDALRMVKTDEEIALLQRAIDITTAAHREAMKSIEPGMHEYEAEALVEYIFHRNGAEDTGFPSIAGSGENAVILHYNSNRRRMQAEDLLVLDIGAEYHGYTADVTRTVPVDGAFSPEQQAIYEIVLEAQQAGIEASRAGSPFSAPGQAATRVVADGLRRLGLIRSEEDVRNFFMHGTSHYLGLYVHDVGTGGELVPGTVITVEPGIYISPSPDVDPKWWNIGVRIEDDVLITDGDPVNLSAEAPRTVEDIERLMQERGLGNDPAGLLTGDEATVGSRR